ncbi:hypothetical protein, partial [Burkholderia multivorans]|uniref:hypothetical protein n=1 Tax=Burkholderia multivorans TaxID=87883 RepID=UPI0020B1F4DE
MSTIDGWAIRLIASFPSRSGHDPDILRLATGNVPQTVEGWDGGCGIDYATLRSWSMLDFEGERFRAAASTQS